MLKDFLKNTTESKKVIGEDEITLTEEIEEMFEEHSLFESEKTDRRKKSKHQKNDSVLYK